MTRLSEKYFGDMLRHNIEDEYLNLPIIPAKPRVKKIDEVDLLIAKHELKSVIREFKR